MDLPVLCGERGRRSETGRGGCARPFARPRKAGIDRCRAIVDAVTEDGR